LAAPTQRWRPTRAKFRFFSAGILLPPSSGWLAGARDTSAARCPQPWSRRRSRLPGPHGIRSGTKPPPRLVALAYVALGDADQGRSNVWDFYSPLGEDFAGLVTSGIATGPDAVRQTLTAFADIGATDLILNPAVGDPDEITRFADIVL
jgi:hypothetical protein